MIAEWNKAVDRSFNVGAEDDEGFAFMEESSPEAQGMKKLMHMYKGRSRREDVALPVNRPTKEKLRSKKR